MVTAGIARLALGLIATKPWPPTHACARPMPRCARALRGLTPLAVVWSYYLAVDPQAIGAGFTEGMGEAEHQQLEDEVEDAAKNLAGDIDLFGETDGEGGAR